MSTTGSARRGRLNSTSSRDQLLKAGAELLARNPRATLDEIARTAKVGRATLHRHFSSRADLLQEIGFGALKAIETALQDAKLDQRTAEDALRGLIDVLTPHGVHAHFLLYAPDLLDDPRLRQVDERVNVLIWQVLERARHAGLIRSDLPDAWVSASLEALLYAAWSAVHLGAVARNDAPGLLLTSFLEGIGNRGPGSND